MGVRGVVWSVLAAGALAGCVLPPPQPGDGRVVVEEYAVPPMEYVVGGAPVYYAVEPGVAYYPVFLDTPGSCHCVVPMRYAGGVWISPGGMVLHRGYLPLRHPAPYQREAWFSNGGIWRGHAPLGGRFEQHGPRSYPLPPAGGPHGDPHLPSRPGEGQPYPYRRQDGPGYDPTTRGGYPVQRQNPPPGYAPQPQPVQPPAAPPTTMRQPMFPRPTAQPAPPSVPVQPPSPPPQAPGYQHREERREHFERPPMPPPPAVQREPANPMPRPQPPGQVEHRPQMPARGGMGPRACSPDDRAGGRCSP